MIFGGLVAYDSKCRQKLMARECWHFLAQSPSEEVLSPSLAMAPEMIVGIS
jgi:hypothetical protein